MAWEVIEWETCKARLMPDQRSQDPLALIKRTPSLLSLTILTNYLIMRAPIVVSMSLKVLSSAEQRTATSGFAMGRASASTEVTSSYTWSRLGTKRSRCTLSHPSKTQSLSATIAQAGTYSCWDSYLQSRTQLLYSCAESPAWLNSLWRITNGTWKTGSHWLRTRLFWAG
jgi:hypothetical protein